MTTISCMDCGLDYTQYPMDVVLKREQWLLIHPEDGGCLCANCIVARASKLPGVINLTARITFGSDFDISDTDRINFIEAHPEMRLNKHKGHWSLQGFTNYAYDVFKTLREAIDSQIGKETHEQTGI